MNSTNAVAVSIHAVSPELNVGASSAPASGEKSASISAASTPNLDLVLCFIVVYLLIFASECVAIELVGANSYRMIQRGDQNHAVAS
jgi:hypothetical protein